MPADNGWNSEDVERNLLDTIRSIRYGAVEVVIHDSRIVQVEKTEKIRIQTPSQHA